MSTKINNQMLAGKTLQSEVGVYILFFKGAQHYYVGSSKVLSQRLLHYLNNTSIISANVKNAIDAFGTQAIQIEIIYQDEDISAIDLLKKEDEVLAMYHRIQGDKYCLNSRNNANTWHSQTYKNKNAIKHKKVECHDKLGNYIATFACINDAVKHFKYDNSGNVVANLKGRVKFTKGMKFTYA